MPTRIKQHDILLFTQASHVYCYYCTVSLAICKWALIINEHWYIQKWNYLLFLSTECIWKFLRWMGELRLQFLAALHVREGEWVSIFLLHWKNGFLEIQINNIFTESSIPTRHQNSGCPRKNEFSPGDDVSSLNIRFWFSNEKRPNVKNKISVY